VKTHGLMHGFDYVVKILLCCCLGLLEHFALEKKKEIMTCPIQKPLMFFTPGS